VHALVKTFPNTATLRRVCWTRQAFIQSMKHVPNIQDQQDDLNSQEVHNTNEKSYKSLEI
jgi:hypothetical protein